MSRLDDFAFVKAAHFDELYKRIEDAVVLYEKELYPLFCGNCRLPLEQALFEFYHIAGIEKIPNTAASMIASLSIYLPEELFPLSYKDLFTELNQTSCKYNHIGKYPLQHEWHDDAEKCYRLMNQCFRSLESFNDTFARYQSIHGPIDYKERLQKKLAAKSVLPQFNSVKSTQQPDYTSICLTQIDEKKRYQESLELDLPTIFEDIYNDTKETYTFLIESLDWVTSDSGEDASLAFLKEVHDLVPRLIATRHTHSYYSLIHSILFRDSWTPEEIADAEYAGTNQSLKDIYWGLTHINLFASKVVIDKLSGNELIRKAIKESFDVPVQKGVETFWKLVEKLPTNDITVLDNIGNFRRYLILRDCGTLVKVKEQVVQCVSKETVSTEDISKIIRELINNILTELYNASKNEDWLHLFLFEQKYIIDILDNEEVRPYLDAIKDQEDERKNDALNVLVSSRYLTQIEEFNVKRKQYKKDLESFVSQVLEGMDSTDSLIDERISTVLDVPVPAEMQGFDMRMIVYGMFRFGCIIQVYTYILQNRPFIFMDGQVMRKDIPYDRVLSSEEVFVGLKSITPLAAVSILSKLKCDHKTGESLKKAFIEDNRTLFSQELDSLECDKSMLYSICGYLPSMKPTDLKDVIGHYDEVKEGTDCLYDYFLMMQQQHSDIDFLDMMVAMPEALQRMIASYEQSKDMSISEDARRQVIEQGFWPAFGDFIGVQLNVCDFLNDLMDSALSFEKVILSDLNNRLGLDAYVQKLQQFSVLFQEKGIPATSLVMPKPSPTIDFHSFYYSLPEDLFSGKVDYTHPFIPGLRNSLKSIDQFEPLFNYILCLGSISSDEEAGALLRAFTGYPVDNAIEKAKWETDYHILYYLVKYMFTPKKSYSKMMESIEISYPSDDDRMKAEKSPSSYAERISGDDAPSIIEILSRLAPSAFPEPDEPLTD